MLDFNVQALRSACVMYFKDSNLRCVAHQRGEAPNIYKTYNQNKEIFTLTFYLVNAKANKR